MLSLPSRQSLACAGLCVCLPLVSPAQAQHAQTPDQTRPTAGYVREMKYLDSNGDRRIDARELAAGQQMAAMMLMLSWETCDRDGDGAISPAEFQSAAAAAQTLVAADGESQQQAQEELGRLMSLNVLLDRLAQDERYTDEIAALRRAVADLDDDDAIITHITTYPKHYPHVAPIVRTWHRYYPARAGARGHGRLLPRKTHRTGPKAGSHRGPKPIGGKAGGPHKPAKKAGKPARKPRPGP